MHRRHSETLSFKEAFTRSIFQCQLCEARIISTVSAYYPCFRRRLLTAPKARIIGAVSDIENGRHLSCCVRLHLLKEGLEVGALQQKSNSPSLTSFPTFASQNLISVIGPGLFPLFSSSAESLPSTSSV